METKWVRKKTNSFICEKFFLDIFIGSRIIVTRHTWIYNLYYEVNITE